MSTVRIQLRRGLSTNWTSVNPILAAGEAGFESDTLKIKIGDGTSHWNDLGYATVTPQNLTDAIASVIAGEVSDYATLTDLSTAISTEVTNRNSAIDNAKSEAISSANTYTDQHTPVAGTDFIAFSEKGVPGGVAELGEYGTVIAPGNGVLLNANGSYNIKLEVNNPTQNRTIYLKDADGTIAFTSDVDNAINNLVNNAPSALNTLKELADAINDDSSFAATVTTALSTKLSKSGGTMSGTLNMGTNIISNLDAPSSNTDAVNKEYVDLNFVHGSSVGSNIATLDYDHKLTSSQIPDTLATKTYADNKSSEAITAAESYADNVKSQAILTAENYTDTAKSNAISTAESYTDNQISNLVNAAPSTLDTLKELADAIGDDPSFAVTVANHIDSAKSDAESYTDSAISTEVTNRNNAINTAKNAAISTSETYTDNAISGEVSNRNSAIATSLSTAESYTDTAKNAAISTSETYTDSAISTEVTNRNSAILTAKNQAISTSEGYTDTAISTEVTNRNSAIATSLTTAENYADTAKSSAISTSEGYTDNAISTEVTNRNSAIATAKSQAISTSEGYTDSAISTEVTNRNFAIATSLTTAEGYTDTKIATEVTNRNSAILSAISTEVTNRNSAIATSLTTAEGYTDSAIATEVSNRNTAISNATQHMVQTTDTGSVTSAMILDGTIVDADISTSAAILATKIAGTAVTQADTATVTNTMLAGSIADTKLNTISTSGKVANSATTATDANTASTIVARDASGNFSANLITINQTPTSAGHAASKAYVDNLTAGMNWHSAVQAATAGVLPASTYTDGTTDANGGKGIGATLVATANGALTVDGVSVSNGNRVLVKNQATASQNGIYIVTSNGGTSSKWTLTRATDSDDHIVGQVVSGDAVYVLYGSNNGNQSFVETATGTGTNGALLLGTDSLTWTQFSGAATFIAGNGLTRTGNEVDVVSSTLNVTADSVDLANVTQTNTTGGVSPTRVTAISVDSYGRITGYTTGTQAIATTSTQGIASFTPSNFSVNSGVVSLASGGVSNANLANSSVTIGSTSVALGATVSTVAGLTLTSPVIAQISNAGTLTLPTSTDTLVGRATNDTLTNKTISGLSNTISNIANSSLTNSSISINGTAVSLGGSIS